MYTLQAPKKSNGCMTVLAVIGGLTVIVMAGILFFSVLAGFNIAGTREPLSGVQVPGADLVGNSGSHAETQVLRQPAPILMHEVVYKVTSNRDWDECYSFDATYEMPDGTSQSSASICGGAQSAVVNRRTAATGDFVYLSVQNDEMWATIGCEIEIDGVPVFVTHSTGQFVIASCSGAVPAKAVASSEPIYVAPPAPYESPPFYSGPRFSAANGPIMLKSPTGHTELYQGPGLDYLVMGYADENNVLRIVGRTADNHWLQLEDGDWIERVKIAGTQADFLPIVPVN